MITIEFLDKDYNKVSYTADEILYAVNDFEKDYGYLPMYTSSELNKIAAYIKAKWANNTDR